MMSIAEELAKITDEARACTSVDRRFNDIVKMARDAASREEGEVVLSKFSLYGLTHPGELAFGKQAAVAGENSEAIAKSLLADQDAVFERLRKAGFEVVERPLKLPAMMDPTLTKEQIERIETFKRCYECEVVVSWESLTKVRPAGEQVPQANG